MKQKIRRLDGERGAILAKMEIERAAERLIKVYARKTSKYVAEQIKIAEKNSDGDGQTYWEKVAKEVEKRLSF